MNSKLIGILLLINIAIIIAGYVFQSETLWMLDDIYISIVSIIAALKLFKSSS